LSIFKNFNFFLFQCQKRVYIRFINFTRFLVFCLKMLLAKFTLCIVADDVSEYSACSEFISILISMSSLHLVQVVVFCSLSFSTSLSGSGRFPYVEHGNKTSLQKSIILKKGHLDFHSKLSSPSAPERCIGSFCSSLLKVFIIFPFF